MFNKILAVSMWVTAGFMAGVMAADYYTESGLDGVSSFDELAEVRNVPDADKWAVFMRKRGEWGMCSPTEIYREVDNIGICEVVPVEFRGVR